MWRKEGFSMKTNEAPCISYPRKNHRDYLSLHRMAHGVMVMLLIIPGIVRAQTWYQSDHVGASMLSLSSDPVESESVFVTRLFANLYRSMDGGGSWSIISTPWLPSSNSILCFALDPATTPHTMFACWYGIYRSANDGVSWSNNVGSLSQYIDSLAIDSTSTPSTIYAGSESNGVYWSTDAGASWTQGTGFPASVSQAFALAVDSTRAGTVYVGFYGNGVYKSTDYGVSWTSMSVGNAYVTALAFDAQNDLYASTNGGSLVYKLPDGTSSWVSAGFSASSWAPWAIAAHPTNIGEIYVGGTLSGNGIRRTTDGGSNWSDYSTGLGNKRIKDLHTIPGAVFAATENGVYMLPLATLALSGLVPDTGAATGGVTITITGSGFTGTTALTFGGTDAVSFVVDSDTQITAVSPAHAEGVVDVIVTTLAGTSPAGTASKFTYTAVPVELQSFSIE